MKSVWLQFALHAAVGVITFGSGSSASAQTTTIWDVGEDDLPLRPSYAGTTAYTLTDYLSGDGSGVTFALKACDASYRDYFDSVTVGAAGTADAGKLVVVGNSKGHVHADEEHTTCTVTATEGSTSEDQAFTLRLPAPAKPPPMHPLALQGTTPHTITVRTTRNYSRFRLSIREVGGQSTLYIVPSATTSTDLTFAELTPDTTYEIWAAKLSIQAFHLYGGTDSAQAGVLVPAADPDLTWAAKLGSLAGRSSPSLPATTEVLPVVTLSLSSASISENGGAATVTATVDPASNATTTITVAAAPVAPAVAADFLLSQDRTLTIASGQTSSTGGVTITAVDNTVDVADKTVTVSGAATNSEGVADPADVTLIITDDDIALTLSAVPNPVPEGSPVTVTATLSKALSSDVIIPLTLTAGTAESGDYGSVASITIGSGSTAGTGTITTTADVDLDDETFTVAFGALPASTTAGDPASVTVTIQDTSVPPPPPPSRPTVTLSAVPNPVPEGSPVTVTATLSKALSSDVIIPLTLTAGTAESGDYGSVASITIGSGSTAGTGTITTTADVDLDDETFTVAFGALPASTMAGDPASVTVTIQDTSVPPPPPPSRPTVTLSAVPNPVPEGSPVTVTATLSKALSSDVIIPLTLTAGTAESGDYGSVASITIGSGGTAGTGTITTTADVDLDDETFTVAFGALPASTTTGDPASVTVTIRDASKAGVGIHPTELEIVENGGTASYRVRLTSQPMAQVSMTVESQDPAAVTVSPSMLMFDASNWNVDQVVTVRALDDRVASGDRLVVIRHSAAGGGYDGVRIPEVSVTVLDDDVAGIEISATSVRVTESGAGSTVSWEVALQSRPVGDAVIAVRSGDETVVSVSPSSLTFGPANWDQQQQVRVTAVNDDIDNASDRVTHVEHAVTSGYGGVAPVSVEVAVENDDVAGVELSASTLTVAEGDEASYTVKLVTEPTGIVTVSVASDAPEAQVQQESLIFTPLNWHRPQQVTVRAVDDDIDSPSDRSARIDHAVAGYGEVVAGGVVAVVIEDDDVAGVELSTTRIAVAESGPENSEPWTAVLMSEPTGPVTLTAEADDSQVGFVTPASVTFTPEDWRVEKTFLITAVDDDIVNREPRRTSISNRVAGGGYDEVVVDSIDVSVEDDDDLHRERSEAVTASLAGLARTVASDAVDVITDRFDQRSLPRRPRSMGAARASGAEGAASKRGLGPGTPSGDRAYATEPSVNGRVGEELAREQPGASDAAEAFWPEPGAMAPPNGSGAGDRKERLRMLLAELRRRGFDWRFDGNGDGDGDGPRGGVWGRVTNSRFTAQALGRRVDGDLVTGYVGVDFLARENLLLGIAASHSMSEMGVSGALASDVDASLTSLQPYGQWRFGKGDVWGLLGAGRGRLELLDVEGGGRADLTLRLAALGGSRDLWRGGPDGFVLSLKSDAFLASIEADDDRALLAASRARAERVRLMIDGRWNVSSSESSRVSVSGEIGGRWDGGHAEGGMGAEIGGELLYQHLPTGLTLEASGRYTPVHEASVFEDWGFGLALGVAPRAAGDGAHFRVGPTWGSPEADVRSLWSGGSLLGAPTSSVARPHRQQSWRPDSYEAEFGYGWFTDLGLGDAYASLAEHPFGSRDYRVGGSLSLSERLALGLSVDFARREGLQEDQVILISVRRAP